MRIWFAVAAIGPLAWACSTSSSGAPTFVPFDAQAYCGRIGDTGDCGNGTLPMDECIQSVSEVVVPSACNGLIAKASCDDLRDRGSSLGQTCFPANGCSALDVQYGAMICSGAGLLTQCFETDSGVVEGESLDCHASCKSESKSFNDGCATQCGACNNRCPGPLNEDGCCCQ